MTLSIPFDIALAEAPRLEDRHPRELYLVHMSFCGSTLLATMCDEPGSVFVAREPQALVDMSDWYVAIPPAGDPSFAGILAIVRRQLAKRWTPNEAVVVKPSNWVNPMLDALLPDPASERIALIDITLEDFLLAVLRGGRARIGYTLACLNHHVARDPAAAAMVAAADSAGGGSFDRLARLVAVFHRVQVSTLAQFGLPGHARIGFRDIVADPATALARAGVLLGLSFTPGSIAAAAARQAGRHAKAAGQAYDPVLRREEDAALGEAYARPIEHARAWIAHAWPVID